MKQNMVKEIGLRIKNIRESMNMSKEKFAKQLGISGQYLGIVEKGNSCLAVDKLQKLCEFTNYSADYILFGQESRITTTTKDALKGLSDSQIKDACKALSNIAIFIKDA